MLLTTITYVTMFHFDYFCFIFSYRIITLLDSVMFVFANLLQQWLLDGTLNVHNTEVSGKGG